jgi:hypothetical protein
MQNTNAEIMKANGEQNNFVNEFSSTISRRHLLKRAGVLLGAGSAFAALLPSARANPGQNTVNEIDGLWQSVVSTEQGSPFSIPPFMAFEIYAGTLWLGSGQNDLTPPFPLSTLWAVFSKIGPSTYQGIGRVWTYDGNYNSTGYLVVVQTTVLSPDGKTYQGTGLLQFFDNNFDNNGNGNFLGQVKIFDNGTRIA